MKATFECTNCDALFESDHPRPHCPTCYAGFGEEFGVVKDQDATTTEQTRKRLEELGLFIDGNAISWPKPKNVVGYLSNNKACVDTYLTADQLQALADHLRALEAEDNALVR